MNNKLFKSMMLFFIILFFLNINNKNVFAVDNKIRIGLFFDNTKYEVKQEFKKFSINSDSGLMIEKCNDTNIMNTLKIIDDAEVNVIATSSGKEIIIFVGENTILDMAKEQEYFKIKPVVRNDSVPVLKFNTNNDMQYRGYIELRNSPDNKFLIINELNLEEYLYGVVPKEIGSNAPIEAIKAQAVAARTYTISHINKYEELGFSLSDNICCQVYKGYGCETQKVNTAVDETKGLKIIYNGLPAKTFYFASSGGITEDVENVWCQPIPYLRSVDDSYEGKRISVCDWTIKLTQDEINNILTNKGIDIGNIVDIEITQRAKSGRVIEMVLKGNFNNFVLKKGKVRSPFNLKSQWFDLKKEGEYYIFTGKGAGHAVGMSQIGAMGMADMGFNFKEILCHYFTGVTIE